MSERRDRFGRFKGFAREAAFRGIVAKERFKKYGVPRIKRGGIRVGKSAARTGFRIGRAGIRSGSVNLSPPERVGTSQLTATREAC